MLRRIVEISYRLQLGHLGSCITALPIIDEIYAIKKLDEQFVLSAGHAGLALYCVLEKYSTVETGKSAEEIFAHHGVHPDRCVECGIDCSSGSLGHGIGIALGMALADRTKNVYCLLSDGEMAEGSVSEAIHIAYNQKVTNLKLFCNHNGYGAYREIPNSPLRWRDDAKGMIKTYYTNMKDYPKYLQEQLAHYKILTDDEYKEVMEILQ